MGAADGGGGGRSRGDEPGDGKPGVANPGWRVGEIGCGSHSGATRAGLLTRNLDITRKTD